MAEDTDDTDIAVSLLLVRGTGHEMEYLLQGREVDKSDHPNSDLFGPGRYPFYWPGSVALFGEHMKPGEDAAQALYRGMNEELPELSLTQDYIKANMDHRIYDWSGEDIPIILTKAQEVFQGNIGSFLGFDLDSPIPLSALGKDRHMAQSSLITYLDWMKQRAPDHYFAMNIGDNSVGNGLIDMEGVGAHWAPHWLTRSIATIPVDKIAILDDMTKRIISGELEIEVKR